MNVCFLCNFYITGIRTVTVTDGRSSVHFSCLPSLYLPGMRGSAWESRVGALTLWDLRWAPPWSCELG